MSARLFAAALLASSAAPALAQQAPVAIVHAMVVIGDGSAPLADATVVFAGGKVVAAGKTIAAPAGAQVIDAHGGWVAPGLVAAVTDLGLVDVGEGADANDSDAAKSPFSAALDLAPAINPAAQPIAVARGSGVTRAAVAPLGTASIFGGQGAVIDLSSSPRDVTQARAFQWLELGEAGAKAAGGSRVAVVATLRNALAEARELAAAPAARRHDALLNRPDAAALVAVVSGAQALWIHAERAADIRIALALKAEFPALRPVIVGASEGWLVARELAAAGVPVLASPLNDLPARFEQLGATESNIGRMTKAGVMVGIGMIAQNHPPAPAQDAGNLVALARVPGADGLSWGQAFATISSLPAEIMGQGEHFGSLRPGRAADVVLWDGDPLEVGSGVTREWIGGVEQSLANHQTRLRDRYLTPAPSALPKAYDPHQ